MSQNTFDDTFTSGSGPVPSGNMPMPEQMLTKFYVAIRRH